jgi:acetyl esterase/lipase
MDIYVPHQLKRDPAPVLLRTKFGALAHSELLERGYVIAFVLWREPPDYKFPIGIEDAKCAVRYLRAHAATYHIDPNQIGAIGCSRGGYMAAMLGLTDPSAGMEGESGFADQSSRVQAVVVRDGIASFATNYADFEAALAGTHGITSPDDPLLALLSPVTHISSDDPPVLLIVSEGDNIPSAGLPTSEMQRLYEALTSGGVSASWIEVKEASHCNFTSGAPPSSELADMIADFFDQTLK